MVLLLPDNFELMAGIKTSKQRSCRVHVKCMSRSKWHRRLGEWMHCSQSFMGEKAWRRNQCFEPSAVGVFDTFQAQLLHLPFHLF